MAKARRAMGVELGVGQDGQMAHLAVDGWIGKATVAVVLAEAGIEAVALDAAEQGLERLSAAEVAFAGNSSSSSSSSSNHTSSNASRFYINLILALGNRGHTSLLGREGLGGCSRRVLRRQASMHS